MDYITPEQMRAVEINSEHLGVPRAVLMENAGRQVFLALKKRLRSKVYAEKKRRQLYNRAHTQQHLNITKKNRELR